MNSFKNTFPTPQQTSPKNLLGLALLRIVTLVYFRQPLLNRVLLIGFLSWLFPDYLFVNIISILLQIEAVIFVFVLFLDTVNRFLFASQTVLHRINPNFFGEPKPLQPLPTANLPTLQPLAHIERLIPISVGEAMEVETIEAETVNPYHLEPYKLHKIKNDLWQVNDEQLTVRTIKNRLSSNKSKLNPNKPSPKVMATIQFWQTVLNEIEREGMKEKQSIDKEFTNSLNIE